MRLHTGVSVPIFRSAECAVVALPVRSWDLGPCATTGHCDRDRFDADRAFLNPGGYYYAGARSNSVGVEAMGAKALLSLSPLLPKRVYGMPKIISQATEELKAAFVSRWRRTQFAAPFVVVSAEDVIQTASVVQTSRTIVVPYFGGRSHFIGTASVEEPTSTHIRKGKIIAIYGRFTSLLRGVSFSAKTEEDSALVCQPGVGWRSTKP
ncbi:hypothetical protein EI94DRAFT_1699420 [Lactarius quietus]|nr:hypothetical protein EI94DRAFT_1699420 [Lactarius quietus]